MLDRRARQADIAAMAPSSGACSRPSHLQRCRPRLDFFSAFAAFYFVSTFTDKPAALRAAAHAESRLLVFVGGAHAGDPRGSRGASRSIARRGRWRFPFTSPASSSRRRCTWSLTVALRMGTYWAIGESLDTWLHEAQEMLFLNFDWEMMTYWTIVGVGTALRYLHEARARELNAVQLETRLVEARLHTLQRQMQPHFLFNTLNTISALMHRDVDAADAMIARLSDLLRMSLQRVGVQEVPLEGGARLPLKYLEIEQTRFRDRLTVVFDVQAETLHALVPNLCCSRSSKTPLSTASGPRPTPGQIAVRARINGAMLELDVQDNGVGLSAARLTDFNRGVGLSNTRSRLDHLYGSLHRFEFRQPAEGGLLVCIAIPMAELASEEDGRGRGRGLT